MSDLVDITNIEDEAFDWSSQDDKKLDLAKSQAVIKLNRQTAIYEKDEEKFRKDKETVQKNLWQYLEHVGKKIGEAVIVSIKYLWAAMTNPKIPLKAKLVAISALVYFISPVDVIPDILPGIGFVDDGAAIAAAVASISFILLNHGIQLHEENHQKK